MRLKNKTKQRKDVMKSFGREEAKRNPKKSISQ